MASQPPLKRPCFLSASKVYAEHVGLYLHVAGVKGEISNWYNLTRSTKGAITIFFIDIPNVSYCGLICAESGAVLTIFELNTQGNQFIPYFIGSGEVFIGPGIIP